MIRLARMPVRRRSLDENIVPMINVVFLLLLFFIVAGNLGEMKHPQINLPSSISERVAATQPLSLVLTEKGELIWNARTITLGELPQLISKTALGPEKVVRLRADARAQAHYLIPVMDVLKKSHISRLAIITVTSEKEI